jgi:hypothetical protein
MANAYRISEVAQKAGVTPDTIRYYERLGVLPWPPRTAGGLRAYGDDVLPRVRFRVVHQTGSVGAPRCRRIRSLSCGPACSVRIASPACPLPR